MNTIKEVYDQLPKEDLGRERSELTISGLGKVWRLCGLIDNQSNSKYIVRRTDYPYTFDTISPEREVEWIGNKPKTKKLYAALIGITPSKNVCTIEWFAEKEAAEDFGDFVEWLPEDDPRFAPIDLDSSPQSDQK